MFDAGAIQAHLDVDLSSFDRKMDQAEARVKRFEDADHKVKISAVFDDASMGRARQMFTQLDQQLSRDAMSRLRSSPQGSVLGALNALFSPHPVTGGPSPQAAASGGLLGRIISAPGGGLAGGGGTNLGQVLVGQAAGSTGNQGVQRIIVQGGGLSPQDADKLTSAAESAERAADDTAQAATATTDAARETAQAAKDTSSSSRSMLGVLRGLTGISGGGGGGGGGGTGFLSRLATAGSIRELFGGGGSAAAAVAAGAAGGGARGFAGLTGNIGPFTGGIIGGIGPGISGVSPLLATGIAGGGVLAAALPAALTGAAGLGVAGAGAALLISQNAKLQAQAKSMLSDLESTVTKAASPLIAPLEAAFAQIPKFVASIAPELKELFAASAPALTLFLQGIELFVKNLLPGLLAGLQAGRPAFQAISDILATLGSQLGSMFRIFSTAIGPSATILKALLDVIGSLLPFIARLGVLFAQALAPVVVQFAKAFEQLMPTLDIVGRLLASLAGAVLTDLVSILVAVVQALVAAQPGIQAFASAFSHVFTVLENNGVFATLGNVIEALAAPLGKLISLLLIQLAPLIPVILTLVTKLSTVLLDLLAAGLNTVLTGLTELLTHMPFLVPLLGAITVAWAAWNLVISLNPIGAIIVAIIALIGAITLLATHWHQVWTDMTNWAMDAWNFLTHGWGQFLLPGLTAIRLAVEFVRDNWRQAWQDMQNWGEDFWQWLDQVFGHDIGGFFTQTLPGWFQTAVQGIEGFWDKVEDVIEAPVKFVIDNVLDGLISVFDDITNAVGLGKPIGQVHPMGLQAGGRIPGYGGGDRWPALLESGEAVVPKHLAATAEFANWALANGIPGYAAGAAPTTGQAAPSPGGGGGIFSSIWHGITSTVDKAIDLGKMALAFATGNATAFTNAFDSVLGLGNGGATHLLGGILTSMPKTIIKDLVGWLIGQGDGGASGSAIADYAMTWLGKIPYVWGGTAVPGGADCSGFVQTIYKHFGINAPRTSEDQGSWVKRAGPQAGGLAFYHSPAGGPDPGHVAIIRSASQVISQGGGMGPQLIGINALPLLWTGIPPGGLGTGGGGANTTGTMSAAAISQLWTSLGGPAFAAANMARIAFAESGDNPSIVQSGEPPNLTGWGLYQITPTSGIVQNGAFGNLLNASNNTRAAISLFSASGYGPWASDPVGASLSAAPFGYAKGGLINEPVIGFGTLTGNAYKLGEAGPEWVTPVGARGNAPAGSMIGNVFIQLPEGQTVAKALSDVSYWIKVAQQQNYVGVLPGG